MVVDFLVSLHATREGAQTIFTKSCIYVVECFRMHYILKNKILKTK